jgi:hypothetical protein
VPRASPYDPIGVTDNEWFEFLSQQTDIGEVYFYGVWSFGYFMETTTLAEPGIRE